MIYCVIPEALAEELYDKMQAYYDADPNVEVIIDRRRASRRGGGADGTPESDQRTIRDRRRMRVPGDLPDSPPGD